MIQYITCEGLYSWAQPQWNSISKAPAVRSRRLMWTWTDSAPLKLHRSKVLQHVILFPFPFSSTEAAAAAPVHVALLAHCFTMALTKPGQQTHKTKQQGGRANYFIDGGCTLSGGKQLSSFNTEQRSKSFMIITWKMIKHNKTIKAVTYFVDIYPLIHFSYHSCMVKSYSSVQSCINSDSVSSLLPNVSTVVMHVSSSAWHSWVLWLHSSLVEEELHT